ncbi:ATP-binding protein [Roseateles sp.]|uniref:sensor histidine kinase n=1 Tax=Roseateles sp. TaxID=1971397 RepID=UPI0025FF4562|nr:ATP-binding protein [Roseateles sp.]MBV8036395.1 two-component sensor histidine kinase [Roseateles sp.]
MRSIERTLLRSVMAALLLGTVLVSAAAYFTTLDEINEALDADLKHVAVSLAQYQDANPAGTRGRLSKPIEGPPDMDGAEIATATWNGKGQLVYASEPQSRIPFINGEGLTRVNVGEEKWIVYTARHREGFAQAAQRLDSRQIMARESAARILPPMLLLAMGIGALLIYGLRYGLRPLDLAAREVAGRSVKSLEPIKSEFLPVEIAPMVAAINGLMARLDDSFTVQRQFLSDAAHELRSPITALRLQLQVLERSTDVGAVETARSELRHGIARAQHLVEQLLQFARTGPEAVNKPLVPTDLNEVVREVVGAQALRAEVWQIDLGASLEQPVIAMGESAQLAILLNNLVENAMRYTPSGGVVDVGTEMRDGRPVLFVLDTGPGIPKEERDRVFDRFYRGEQSALSQRAIVGSGLGLAIVRAIADQHHAVVKLLDRIGSPGLEVRVVFPPADHFERG